MCSRNWLAIKKAQAASQPTPTANPSDVYWIDSATGVPEKVASADTAVNVIAAPSGSQSLIVMAQRSGSGRVMLYNRERRVKELPVDATFLLWGGDSQKVYFYGGTTIQADAWNILGIYDVNNGSITRAKLREPAEILRVCPANGEVYSATPQYPKFRGSTVEYTPEIQFVRQIHGWIGARFSAQCTYVASESDYHGPLPWSIYNTRSAKKLFQFSAADEDTKGGIYSLVAWNPKHDSVLLREHVSEHHQRLLEVFDVKGGRVLQTLPGADLPTWSADGANIIVPDGDVLVWHPVKTLSFPSWRSR